MKLFVILVLCFAFSMSIAQTQPDSSKVFGENSLQFRVYDFISLSSFKGALLSYKNHSSDESAYRFGVSMQIQKWKSEESRERSHIDTTFLSLDTDNNDILIVLSAEYMKYFNPNDDIKLFMGIGPRVSLNLNFFDADNISGDGFSYNKTYKNNHYEFGIVFNYGLEWFFRKNMSLHAEYGLHLSYFYDENVVEQHYPYADNTVRIEKRDEKDSGIILDDAGALLGLSVYF